MKSLLSEIAACRICELSLPHDPRPVVQGSPHSRIVVIGQAPGRHVHESGIPWNDPSGVTLRRWLAIEERDFYDPSLVAHMPMAFCYPGKGKSGDLPPRLECAKTWHQRFESELQNVRLKLIIGAYAQKRYLPGFQGVTETMRRWREFGPILIPLPHPSPLNRRWMKNNPWFELKVLPELRQAVQIALAE